MRVVLQDGELRPAGRIELDVDDEGFQRGIVVFETLRSHGGAFPHLDLHLDRLAGSAHALRVPLPPREVLAHEVALVAERLGQEAVVRISLTAGGSRIVQARPLPAAPAEVRVATRPWPAHPWLSGRVKHASRAVGIAAVRQAGVDEVLWLGPRGELLEGTWSNVFAVSGGALHTPEDDGRILPGITRHMVLETARRIGVPVHEGPCPVDAPWQELYLSSSLKMLVPVVELDGRPAPGRGPVGARVLAALAVEYTTRDETGTG